MNLTILSYFKERGIPDKILRKNRIGYGSKNDIQFPYFKDGLTVNVKHRTLEKKFWQERDSEKCLYRFDEIMKAETDTLIITEGEIDALSVQTAGFEAVTSIPNGAPAENAKNFQTYFDFLTSAENILSKYKKIILMMDNDPPGKKAESELARRLGAEKCYRVEYPNGYKDANDILKKYGAKTLQMYIQAAKPFPVEGIFSASDLTDDLLTYYDAGEDRGLSTGWKNLDDFYTVRPGELTIVTGIPASGKSNFIDALLVNLYQQHQWRFAIFSPENWPIKLHIKQIIQKIQKQPFFEGKYTERMKREDLPKVIREMSPYFSFIVPQEMCTVENVLEKARIQLFRTGINGLILDPWNEFDHLYEGKTEAQYLSEKLTKIRRFARMNKIHVWLIAHPKLLIKERSGEYRPPTMYEISGGAHWRNKADNGLCIHRSDMSLPLTEIYIQKIRFREVGKIGKVTLKYLTDDGTYLVAD